jgi:hypothetical protein
MQKKIMLRLLPSEAADQHTITTQIASVANVLPAFAQLCTTGRSYWSGAGGIVCGTSTDRMWHQANRARKGKRSASPPKGPGSAK